MKDELIKWRVMTLWPGGAWEKRGLYETRVNAMAKAKWFRESVGYNPRSVKVVRHVVKTRAPKCDPAVTERA